jgi:predicted permease
MTQDIAWLNLVGRVPGGDARRVDPTLQAANHDGLVELAAKIDSAKERAAMLAHTLAVEPFAHGFSGLRARFSDALFALTAMVALVLLVTCANIANLLLARGAAQARDLSIRLSLGATRARLVRQCLTESLVLALLGGAAGVWISQWGSRLLAHQVLGTSGQLPAVFAPDIRVIAFAAAISVTAAIVFGLAPAFRAIAAARTTAIGGSVRAAIAQPGMAGMRWLVIAQLALSVVVVSAAALLGRTLLNFMRIDPGFAADRLITVSLDPVSSNYAPEQLPALARRLVETARAVPGVTGAAASTCGLIAGCSSSGGYRIEGAGDENRSLYRNWVTPGYFATAGIRLVNGRDFSDRDNAAAPHVAIVNESAVQHYFPGRSPIGKRIWLGQVEIEIVGVVRDVRTQSLHDLPVPMAYFPIEQRPPGRNPTLTDLNVRVAANAVSMETTLRDALQRGEPNLLIGGVGAMSRRLERDLTRERIVAWLALAFAAMTLLLAAIGLYGVLAYGVTRRTQEIGVRMALGARPFEMLLMIAGQSARLALAGLVFGVMAAAALSRYLSALLFGVTPLDPLAFLGVALAFLIVTLLASVIPVRRATSVDPLVALRCE